MKQTPLPFRLLAVFTVMSALLLSPGQAVGQGIPTNDTQAQRWWGLALAQRLTHAYVAAREWRDATMNKANGLIRQTRRLTRTRQKYENMAIGELGQLGNRVPDWRDYSNFCAVEVDGTDVCEVEHHLSQRFERALGSVYRPFAEKVFDTMDDTEDDLRDILGRRYASGIDSAIAAFGGDGVEGQYVRGSGVIQVTAENSPVLEEAAQTLNLVLDSVTVREIQDQQLSSGRADQISTYLAFVEASVEIENTRAILDLLDARILGAADVVREMRRGKQTNRVTQWW